jgi:plasmid maintenance system killer protein
VLVFCNGARGRLFRNAVTFVTDMKSVFIMTDTFLEALARAPKDIAAKLAKALNFLRRDPRHPSLNYESLHRDSLFSFRVDQQYRVILRELETAPALLYVGNHDDAYRFAERTPEWGMEAPPDTVAAPLFSVQRMVERAISPDESVIEVLVNGQSQGRLPTRGLSLRQFAELHALEHGIRAFVMHVDGTKIAPSQTDVSTVGVSRIEIIAKDRRGAGVEEPPIRYRLSTAPAPFEMVGALIRTRKYLPLAHLLLSRPVETAVLEMAFAEVERIIGAKLPASAHEYDAWWRATDHSQASAWLSVGWKVAHVSRTRQRVTFERIRPEHDFSTHSDSGSV